MHAIVFLVVCAPPEFRDWSTDDGLIHAKYCWMAFDDVLVEDEFGLKRKLDKRQLSSVDLAYLERRRKIARDRRPRIRIAESRKNMFWNDPGRVAYWAKARLKRRALTITKFDRMVGRAAMARMSFSPLGNAAVLSRMYNGPPTPRRRPADIVVEYSFEIR